MVALFDRYRKLLVEAMAEALPNEGPLSTLLRYPLGLAEADGRSGPGIAGKLLRPSLTLFACEALGGKVELALPLAMAVELVHNFSLVHDDIQDGDELRRGRPTAWKAFGIPQAINAGDGLLVFALRMAVSDDNLGEEALLTAQRALISAILRLIEGQVMDLELAQNVQTAQGGVAPYLEMAVRKTGALFGCALELGAIAAEANFLEGHRRLGEKIGLAFQVSDDILGIWGEVAKTGKPVGSDLLRRKYSYPVALALEKDPSFADLLRCNPIPMEEAMVRLEEIGARRMALQAVAQLCQEAEAIAQTLPWSSAAKKVFGEFLMFLVEREA